MCLNCHRVEQTECECPCECLLLADLCTDSLNTTYVMYTLYLFHFTNAVVAVFSSQLHMLSSTLWSDCRTRFCWWQKSVDVCDQLMLGHVLYRGPGPSLVTGVLLWLVWNSLPATLHDMNTIYSFRKQLKMHLFSGGWHL